MPSEPRVVTVTLGAIRSLTILEIARASATANVKRSDTQRLLRSLTRADSDPADLEQGALLMYAWAWQLVRRDEPATTWAEAQTWRVEFDLTQTDPVADAEAEAVAYAAAVTGTPPSEARNLTLADLEAAGDLAGRR